MGEFDVNCQRAALLSDVGAEWQLGRDAQWAEKTGGLSGSATMMVSTAIYCAAVGLEEYVVVPLLVKAEEWAPPGTLKAKLRTIGHRSQQGKFP